VGAREQVLAKGSPDLGGKVRSASAASLFSSSAVSAGTCVWRIVLGFALVCI
jgi:hypothetical protein